MDEYDEYDTDGYEPIDEGPWHIMPMDDGCHTPFGQCWCRPRFATFCVCHTISKGNTHPHCVMCFGSGYVDSSQDDATVVVHLDATERMKRDLKDIG